MGRDREESREERTDLAQRRTRMAQERTFSAWIRTSLASMAVGFGVARLLAEVQPAWLVTSIALALILLGMAALALGFGSYRRSQRELRDVGPGFVTLWLAGTFAALLALVGLAGAVLVLTG